MLGSGAVDLDLSPEHELLRQTVRDFALREVAPAVEEHERARRFPSEIVARLGPMGLMGVPYPEEEGGAGLDTLAYAIAVEELSRVWGSLGIIVAAHTSLGCGPLHLAGTPEQKARWLVPMAQGRVIGAYGLTEPEAGSDSGGTRTTARHEAGPAGLTNVRPVLDGHLEGGFNRRRPIAAEERMLQVSGCDLCHFLGQPDGPWMRHPAQDGVLKLSRLPADGFDKPRVPVAQVDAPPRSDAV